MTFGENVRALLTAASPVMALCGGRIYPGTAPQGAPNPFIVYNVIEDLSILTLQGSTDGFGNAVIQIDCYAKAYLSAGELAKRVKDVLGALCSPDLSCMRLRGRESYEDETQLHRISADFSMWKRETT